MSITDPNPKCDAFIASLVWLPIAKYDRIAGPIVILRLGVAWHLGYWGDRETDEGPSGAMWRLAQESMMGTPLAFEPDSFAIIGDERIGRLIHD